MTRLLRSMRGLPWRALVPAFATVVLASWVADGIKGEALFAEWHPAAAEHRGAVLLVVVLAFLGSALWLYRERGAFLGVRTLTQRDVDPHAAIVLPISPARIPVRFEGGVPSVGDLQLPTHSIHAAIRALNELEVGGRPVQWPWQQMLRGLAPHARTLRAVCLIGSAGEKGSHLALEDARRLIAAFLPRVRFLEAEVVDFEEVSQLTRCFAAVVRQLKEDGFREEEIVVDVTAGRKPTSIAGAVVTFNSHVTFQYVQSESSRPGEPLHVWAYDLKLESKDLV
jgi:hypothetical protein